MCSSENLKLLDVLHLLRSVNPMRVVVVSISQERGKETKRRTSDDGWTDNAREAVRQKTSHEKGNTTAEKVTDGLRGTEIKKDIHTDRPTEIEK